MITIIRSLTLLLCLVCCTAFANPINIVAAENIYGDLAKALGGKNVNVVSILNSPNDDPHLFNPDPKTMTIINQANIIILNGAGYDPWMESAIKNNTQAKIINVADINHVPNGSNPHLWYNLTYIKTFVDQLSLLLNQAFPNSKITLKINYLYVTESIQSLQNQIDMIKRRHQGTLVTATEPVANYLAEALGLTVLNQDFQLSMMNDTTPSAQAYSSILNNLTEHKAKLLIYNQQVSDPTTNAIKTAAIKANVPVLGVTELLPPRQTYLTWYQATLNQFRRLL